MTTPPRPERHFDTHAPDRVWDYVVIGSGMGGMASAALLARMGARCLVLEQHYVPGGFTHSFKRKRWTWDVGVHAIGEVSPRALPGRILQDLTRGRLEWSSLGTVYDEFHFPDLRLDFPDSQKQFEHVLCDAFPSETAPIRTYLARTREISTAMRSYYAAKMLPPAWAPFAGRVLAARAQHELNRRTVDVLNELTTNKRLQSVLTAQWGYYGSTPDRSSWAAHALVARHFLHGAFYPVGGAGRIADALLATIAEAGGWTRIRADVSQIVVRDGAAVGVQLASGETIRAGRVISAAGAVATVKKLLPPEERAKPWVQSIAALGSSPPHLCLYLGFKGDIRAAGATPANKWFYEVWDSDAAYWNAVDPKAEAPVLYCSFPSLKDPLHHPGPENLHTGEVVTFVPYGAFERWRETRWMKRGDDYEAFKQSVQERMLAQFFRHMPGLRDLVVHAELSTPLSTEWFARSTEGAIYGLEHTPARFANPYLRPRTPVRNLFLSGSDVSMGGVMGAFMGGVLSAASAEPTKTVAYARKLFGR
ncbi:MAG: NAD(P)/FAD-dependent oxidoreductase [Deltaproteobacteria bacterium]